MGEIIAVCFEIRTKHINALCGLNIHIVGPCHHGMARPQVADSGTACDMVGSCEYIE